VASQWRIRHKLLLGLALVMANMAMLLGGSLWGLLSYSSTMKSIDSKQDEQSKAEDVCRSVGELSRIEPKPPPPEQPKVLLAKLELAKEALEQYKVQLHSTLKRRRDPNKGLMEKQLVEALDQGFNDLDRAIQKAGNPTSISSIAVVRDILEQEDICAAIQKLVRTSDELRDQLREDIKQLIQDAQRPYKFSLVTMVGTCCLGVCLMAGLSRYFLIWVLTPIKKLHEGAELLAKGDFEHRLTVNSGDEMQDLAEAFNNMSERLRDIYRDLAHQVNERSRQLVRSERLASVGFLAAGVAHEINNPLASIAFCSEALDGRLARVLPRVGSEGDTIVKYLRTIQEEAFRCKAITQRLLEFSRGGEPHRESTNLVEIVQSVLDMVQHLPNARGKKIDFRPGGALAAWINGQEIKSVILNLVVNALDSMEEGGRLGIALGRRGTMAELVFTDNGCGMNEEVLENLFEPFFTRSRTGKGTGLGLSISHRIITQHGGEIEAASPGLDQGSTFRVRLPLGPAAPVREEKPKHAAAA